MMRRRDLREFAQQPGVFKGAVREILREGPQEHVPAYLTELDAIAEEEASTARSLDNVFVVWEYRGPLEEDEMQALMRVLMMDADSELDPELAEQLVDPLFSVDAAIWFCQGRVLKVAINHVGRQREPLQRISDREVGRAAVGSGHSVPDARPTARAHRRMACDAR